MCRLIFRKSFSIFVLIILALFSFFIVPSKTNASASESGSAAVFSLTAEEREYIKKGHTLNVVFDNYWPPFESLDSSTGLPIGVNVDIIEKIGEITGLRFNYVSGYDYDDAISLVSRGEVDMLLSYDYNPDHAKDINILLSDPFLEAPIAIIGRGEAITDESIFALPSVYVPHAEYVNQKYPNNKLIITETIEECYNMIKSGEADLTLENLYAGLTSINSSHPSLSILSITSLTDRFSFALRKDIDPLLISIINKGIVAIPEPELSALLLENTLSGSENYSPEVFFEHYWPQLMTVVLIVSCVIVIFLLILVLVLRKNKRALWEKAYIDPLTGHGNLNKFKLDAKKLLSQSNNTAYSIVKFDIQQFNLINNMYGYPEGDRVLRIISSAISRMLDKDTEVYSRIGNDEFLLLMEMSKNPNRDDINNLNRHTHNIEGHILRFTAGRYIIEAGETDIDAIFEKVNYAHSMARKNMNSSSVVDYTHEIRQRAIHAQKIEAKMAEALANCEFQVYLQPKFRLSDETLVGAEALVRWVEADGHMIFPNEFIHIFEKNGFISMLDMYMFEKVCGILQDWQKNGLPLICISVNFSRLHLSNPDFVNELADIAGRYNIPKKYLEIEITESVILDNEEKLLVVLEQLHNKGFTLSMDDFGTGYSGLGLLKNLPVDIIKIDRRFFTNNKYKARANSLIRNVIRMAKDLEIVTVAEGVESAEQVDFLREVGCDIVQGYYYSRPMPAHDLNTNVKTVSPNSQNEADVMDSDELGNIELGRAEIGVEMPVLVYRLFQLSVRKALNDEYGEGEMVNLLRHAGKIAGRTFTRMLLNTSLEFDEFFAQLSARAEELQIGLLSLEKFNPETGSIVVSINDDLDCSGMKNIGQTFCQYDEGFISGILYEYANKHYSVTEVECWGTGATACRFEARPM